MDQEEEPELPLEPTPPINWAALRKRPYVLVTAPKIPAWATIALLFVKEIPDWKSRFDFWLTAAKALGGAPGMIASIVMSSYFAPIAGVVAAAYIVLIGEPKKGTQRHHWWPYFGWIVFGFLLSSMVVTGIIGYVEIYVKEEVGKRDEVIQKQAVVRPVFWHLTDFEKTSLAFALDQTPEDNRFQVQVRCLPDAGSRTLVEDLGQVFLDHNWKITANCFFSDVRPDLIGIYLGLAKKHANKKLGELPEHAQTLAKIFQDAHINAQWALDKDDSLGDEVVIIVGNAP